jgi:hypothetical protein
MLVLVVLPVMSNFGEGFDICNHNSNFGEARSFFFGSHWGGLALQFPFPSDARSAPLGGAVCV